VAAVLAAAVGCHRSSFERRVASYPPVIQRACAVMIQRCSKCHSPDRINTVQVAQPVGWERLVNRMRVQPSSGISPADEYPIIRCIVYGKFGFDNAGGRKGGRS
jgi:hypothetical protein